MLSGALHLSESERAPAGRQLRRSDQRRLHRPVLLPAAVPHEQETQIRGTQGQRHWHTWSRSCDWSCDWNLSSHWLQVEGFAVHCGFSADGSVLVSGSSAGSVHFYDYQSSRSLKTLDAHEHACVCAALHPVIPAVTATCDWTGEIKIWTWSFISFIITWRESFPFNDWIWSWMKYFC